MAWPFTPITTYVAGTTPTIKAYDLNQLQAYINNLINGDRSVKKWIVDGTGNVDTSAYTAGAATLNGASGDTSPCIDTTINPTTRKLLWKMAGGTTPVRLYLSDNGLEIVTNAVFATPNWTQDNGALDSSIYTVNGSGVKQGFKLAGSAAWTDSYTNDTASTTAWILVHTAGPVSAGAGGELFVNRIMGYTPAPTIAAGAALGATPTAVAISAGTDLAGLLTFKTDAGAVGAAGTMVTVTFANPFTSTPYVVLSNGTTTAANIGLAGVTRVTANTTTFTLATPAANPLLANTTYDLNYHVIG